LAVGIRESVLKQGWDAAEVALQTSAGKMVVKDLVRLTEEGLEVAIIKPGILSGLYRGLVRASLMESDTLSE
jgi:hypothetical protein